MDASYYDSWHSLKEDGAEVILFSSQASYKSKLSHFSWLNNYYIVSSTGEDARIIDINGEVITEDGEFARWVCATMNLEKELLHIWPHKFNIPTHDEYIKEATDIHNRYRLGSE